MFDRGNDLYSDCQTNGTLCFLNPAAYLDMMQALGYSCQTKGVTKSQVRDVLMAYLQAHPEQRHYSAASLAAKAFENAFACRRGQ